MSDEDRAVLEKFQYRNRALVLVRRVQLERWSCRLYEKAAQAAELRFRGAETERAALALQLQAAQAALAHVMAENTAKTELLTRIRQWDVINQPPGCGLGAYWAADIDALFTKLAEQEWGSNAAPDALASNVTRQRSAMTTCSTCGIGGDAHRYGCPEGWKTHKDRSDAWEKVFDLCHASGMNSNGMSGIDAVLKFIRAGVEARELLLDAYHQLDPIYLADGVTLHPGCVSTLHDLYSYLWPNGKPADAAPDA